jgi:hypothetical protein
VHHRTIQINHQPDATVFQFIILTFVYSSTCFGRFPAHHQELNDCSGSLWFYLRIVVTVVLCSWSGRPTHRVLITKSNWLLLVRDIIADDGRLRLKCYGTRAETRFRISAKRMSPFKSAGRPQFSRLLAAEVCASTVVMLDTPCSEVVWSVLATHSIRHFPLYYPSRASVCAITFQLDSTAWLGPWPPELFGVPQQLHSLKGGIVSATPKSHPEGPANLLSSLLYRSQECPVLRRQVFSLTQPMAGKIWWSQRQV